jgi:hypothetical protein
MFKQIFKGMFPQKTVLSKFIDFFSFKRKTPFERILAFFE